MKKNIIITFFAIIIMSLLVFDASATKPAPTKNDSIAAMIKLRNLRSQRDKLVSEIKIQDAKRNRQVPGVSPETNEEMNDRQDSICLALRSQLTDLDRQIRDANTDNFKKGVAESVQKLKERNKANAIKDSIRQANADSLAQAINHKVRKVNKSNKPKK